MYQVKPYPNFVVKVLLPQVFFSVSRMKKDFGPVTSSHRFSAIFCDGEYKAFNVMPDFTNEFKLEVELIIYFAVCTARFVKFIHPRSGAYWNVELDTNLIICFKECNYK